MERAGLEEERRAIERELRLRHVDQLRHHPHPDAAATALGVEYVTLRQESMAAIASRIQIVAFTVGATAVVMSALVASDSRAAVAAFSIGMAPLFSFAAAGVWLGEYHRSQRAGRGLIEVERSMNAVLGGGEVVLWETSLARDTFGIPLHKAVATPEEIARLRQISAGLEDPEGIEPPDRGPWSRLFSRRSRARGGHMTYPYVAAVALILGVGFAAQIGGFALLFFAPGDSYHLHFLVPGLLLSLALDAVYVRFWISRWVLASGQDQASREARAEPILGT